MKAASERGHASHQAAGLASRLSPAVLLCDAGWRPLSCFASSSLLGSVSQQHQREGARQVAVRRSLGFPCPSASRQSPLLILAEIALFLSSSLFHFIRLYRPRLITPCPATPAPPSSVPTSEGRVSALPTLSSSWLLT